ncbi:beta-N-acetylglucosaminidase domain-containing protein [Halosquirtibacter xylanolyticus]|uniref:beta-N-acetylglucosaminidase domain-containing protein n=1 Tax=Halosquirtibacter xylanolyticus TaxID=3374599 RepID=UPI003749F443|nr:beta-N-acetylglucosaminidase domain-containing protein [Prolixibacteraceae bacterium]
MKTRRTLLLWILLLNFTSFAQNIPSIFPTPQQITQLNIKDGKKFDFDRSYQIKSDPKLSIEHSNSIKLIFPNSNPRADLKIIIGLSSSKHFKKYGKEVPKKSGAYKIQMTSNKLCLIGFDDRGVHYGLQTLKQLLKQECNNIEIIDFPDVKHRGVVEGFYGTPWSFEDRKRQLEFYGKHRLNTYIYGPKDDPYHSSPNWRKPYPEKQANEIKKLTAIAVKNHVDFVWAIHPGKDIQWDNKDQQALVDKFESMYKLGVRGFAVFFDDISGIGTDPKNQASLLNHLIDKFYSKHADLTPLIMCPTEYTKQWADPSDTGYLSILGDDMNESVQVMWTGDAVVGHITKSTLDWVRKRINRNAYIWWNYPVSDYCTHNLLLGPCYGLTSKGANGMNGFVANPMEYATASEISLFSASEYAWNVKAFDPIKSWNRSIETLLPEVADEYKFFADFNVDANASWGWKTGKESIEFKKLIDSHNLEALREQFQQMIISAENILLRLDDTDLKREITPWLHQFKWAGYLGINLLDQQKYLNDGNLKQAWQLLLTTSKIKDRIASISQTENLGRGVEVGSSVLQPFLKTTDKKQKLEFISKITGNEVKEPKLFGYTTIGANSNNVFDEDINTSYTFKKPIKEGDYIGVDLMNPTPIHSIDIYQSSSRDHIKEGVLEYSNDGKSWKLLSNQKYSGPIIHFTGNDHPLQARYIRYVSKYNPTKGKGNWVKIHDIFINRNEPYATLIYSSRPFRNMPFNMDQNSLSFNKKLEITTINPNQKIILSFLRNENIKELNLDLGEQYNQLECYVTDKDNKKIVLKTGIINGSFKIDRSIKRLVIQNKTNKSEPVRLLKFNLVFNHAIDIENRLYDRDFQTAYPLKPKNEITITKRVKEHGYILFKDNTDGLKIELTRNNGEILRHNINEKLYRIPQVEEIIKCKLINQSNRVINIVEIL